MQHSRVCIFLLTRCLIRPSGERSHGIYLALMTFGSGEYWVRNCAASAIASSRKLLVLEPDSPARLSSNDVMAALTGPQADEILRRPAAACRSAIPPFSGTRGA